MRIKRSTFRRKGGIKGNGPNAAYFAVAGYNMNVRRRRYLSDPNRKRSPSELLHMALAEQKRTRRGRSQKFGAWA